MADCYDFFEDSAARRPSRPRLPPEEALRPVFQGEKRDPASRGLELTLGPSNFMGTSASPPIQEHDTVRGSPAVSSLQEQAGGNVALSLRSAVSAGQVPFVQSEGSKLVEDNTAGLGRQMMANRTYAGDQYTPSPGNRSDPAHPSATLAGNSGFPSRDQIWQTLQKGNTAMASTLPLNDSSSMWNRRAISLHATFPVNIVNDLEQWRSRASSSNGVLTHARSQPIPSIELFVDRSGSRSITPSEHLLPDEVEDQQKRKEVQAQRRLQARKRRRILMGEKQHKKGRHSEPFLCNMRSKFPENRCSQGEGIAAARDDDATPESRWVCPDELIFAKPDKLKKAVDDLQPDNKIGIQVSPNDEIEHSYQVMQSDGAVQSASLHRQSTSGRPAMSLPNQLVPGISSSLLSSDLEHSSPMKNLSAVNCLSLPTDEHEGWKVFAANDCVRMQGGSEILNMRVAPSNEAGCVDIHGAPSCAVKEEIQMIRTMPSSSSNAPIGCSSSQSQFTNATVGTVSAMDSSKTNVPFPCKEQHPDAGSHENDFSLQHLTNGHGVYPHISHAGNETIPLSSGACLPRMTSAVGDSEGNRGGSAFYPLSKTFSNAKTGVEEPQNAGARVDFQASLLASQLSSTSTILSGIPGNKNLLLERPSGRPLGGRLLSQNSCVVDQALSCSRPGHVGLPLSHEASSLRSGDRNWMQEEGAKLEEPSSESQLASEHSTDASLSRATDAERVKHGALVNLLWVTTTGNGPNGKTINGFMYIADGSQVRLVCCCHRRHMSPAEFVEHSGSTDLSNPERNIVVSPLPHF